MPIDPSSQLYFDAYGPAQAPAIVFLHGGGAAGWMWDHQVEEFQLDYHVLVPDLPEQGKSTGAGRYTTETAAERVADLIRAQAVGGKANVVGLSEGAQVTVALLARCPEVVERAVVSSAILRPMPGMGMVGPGLVTWSYRVFMAPLKNADWWIRLNMHGSAGLPDEYYPQFKSSFQQTTEQGLADMLVGSMRFRLPAGLDSVDVPVLVIAGTHEYAQMKASARDLVHALPHAQGALLSLGLGSSLRKEHNWAMTAPELFNRAIRAWIADRSLPAELSPLERGGQRA